MRRVVLVALCLIGVAGCAGSADLNETPADPGVPRLYTKGSYKTSLADGARLFYMVEPGANYTATGMAQLYPPPGSPNLPQTFLIEGFDVEGEIDLKLVVSPHEGYREAYRLVGDRLHGIHLRLEHGPDPLPDSEPEQDLEFSPTSSPKSAAAARSHANGGPLSFRVQGQDAVRMMLNQATRKWDMPETWQLSSEIRIVDSVAVRLSSNISWWPGESWAWFDTWLGETRIAAGDIPIKNDRFSTRDLVDTWANVDGNWRPATLVGPGEATTP